MTITNGICPLTLKIDSKFARACYNRGYIYYKLKEYRLAIADFNRVIEQIPNFSCAYKFRGEAYLGLRDIQQARSDCKHSWELSSAHVDHGWMMQWIEMCLEKPNVEMMNRLESIAEAEPKDYNAYLCRGTAMSLRGDFQQAIVEIDQAISLESEKWGAHFWKGMNLASLGDDEEAVAEIEQALLLDMPPILLSPLRWLEQERPEFYQKYALPLLNR